MNDRTVSKLFAAAAAVVVGQCGGAHAQEPNISPEAEISSPWTVFQTPYVCTIKRAASELGSQLPSLYRPFRGKPTLIVPIGSRTPTDLGIRAVDQGMLQIGQSVMIPIAADYQIILDPKLPDFGPKYFLMLSFDRDDASLITKGLAIEESANVIFGSNVHIKVDLEGVSEAWAASYECLEKLGPALMAAAPKYSGKEPLSRKSPLPRQYPINWIKPQDYPLQALRERAQGNSHVALLVDKYGLPSSCKITASAGHAALDDAACERLMKSSQFYPALDPKGDAIEAEWTTVVHWLFY